MYYEQAEINELATTLTELGFTVYVSVSGTHGCYTDGAHSRVVSFQSGLDGVTFSGNYHSSRESGSGWRLHIPEHPLTEEIAKNLLYATAPDWANRKPKYTNIFDHLAFYTASKYTLFQVPTTSV